ncbi:MAG: M23 family peptidase [Epsilonproteobacteria bacterium]|nr:MAG: M23 family peptidase [Campylobacterota bacterium]
MKIILILFLSYFIAFSSSIQEDIWWKGESLITFLDKHKISKDIYFNLSKTDKELCSEIYAGVKYQILYDDNKKVVQILIPISEQMQIYIFQDIKGMYTLDIVPISSQEITATMSVPITYSPYQDIISTTNNKNLANEFIRAFKKSVNFKRIQKGDILAIKYTQKVRNGRYFGVPTILAAKIEVNGRANYIFQNKKDKRYYDFKGRSLTSVFLKVPLRYKRISSKFTQKRWHPILKRYRAHLGIDYAAPSGRKIFATADGKIIHKGRKGGYGKTIMIRHKGGYKSLYAHMSRYAKVKVGQWVKQGKHIGYVGTTGRSTGPHLHFGLYKNGKAVNPARVLSVTKTQLRGKAKKIFISYAKKLKNELNKKPTQNLNNLKLIDFDLVYKMAIKG